MDPGRTKFQSYQNRVKPTPLRRALRAISTIHFFSKMDTVCKSYRVLNFFPNRKKVKVKKSRSIDDIISMDDVSSDVVDDVNNDVAYDVQQ
jgi:hypothetical protein